MQDEWNIVKSVMEVVRPFRYRTLWMSKMHTVPLYHRSTVYNDLFDLRDGIMCAWAYRKTPSKEDLFIAMKLAQQKLSKCSAEVTPKTGMLLITAQILNPFWKLLSFRMWVMGMDIDPEDELTYTTQYKEACLKYVENE